MAFFGVPVSLHNVSWVLSKLLFSNLYFTVQSVYGVLFVLVLFVIGKGVAFF